MENPNPNGGVWRRDFLCVAFIALTVLALDVLSKIIVYHTLRASAPVSVIPGCLRFVYGENPGIAFGLFQNQGFLLHFLTPVAFIVLLVILYQQFVESRMDWLLIWIFGLIIGGAMGNILNRLYNGYVIDFIDFYYKTWQWYTFNIADSALTIGEVLLVGKLLFHHKDEKAKEAKPEEVLEQS